MLGYPHTRPIQAIRVLIMSIEDIKKHYVPSQKTDVLATLIKNGFQPPSECKKTQRKWEIYRNLLSRNEKREQK